MRIIQELFMETSKSLIPVVMMSVTAIASSSLPVQASPPHPLVDQHQQEAVPVLLVTVVPATSITEPEQLIQYRIARAIESGFTGKLGPKIPPSE